eukprot:scaffold684_cov345-Pavlova_lutheri.AAC.6
MGVGSRPSLQRLEGRFVIVSVHFGATYGTHEPNSIPRIDPTNARRRLVPSSEPIAHAWALATCTYRVRG